jgi:site-specific DNA recombinase
VRVLIWAAVSSKDQAGEKESIPSQLETARQHISNREGWHEAHDPLVIPGHTRRYTFLLDACEDMPQYATLMKLARQGEIDLVITRARDRLGRTDSLIATLEQYLSDYGVQILSLDMPTRVVDPQEYAKKKDRAAVWMRSVERAKAATEVLELQERYRMGMHGRIRQGLHPNNRLPMGYRLENGVGVPHEPEAERVRTIYHAYLKGASYRDIMDRYGIPNKAGVYYLLTNVYYCGYVQFSRRGIEADDPPTQKGQHEPIIDEDTWKAVQTEMRRRRGQGQRSPYTRHPLSGFVFCGFCSQPMTIDCATSKGRRYRYYTCEAEDCEKPTARNSIRADYLEQDIAKLILSWLRGWEDAERYMAQFDAALARRAKSEADALARTLQAKRGALRRWTDDYEAGLISRSEYYQRRHALEEEIESLEIEVVEAQGNLTALDPESIHDALSVLPDDPARFAEQWENEPQMVKATLRRIGFRAIHTNGHIKITLAP